jgi:sensor histidine kinase YesM
MSSTANSLVNSRLYGFITRYNIHHLVLWALYLLFWVFVLSPGITRTDFFINSLVIVSIHAAVSYFNMYVLLPFFLQKRAYLRYFVAISLALFLGALLESAVFSVISTIGPDDKRALLSLRFILNAVMAIMYTVAITMSLKLVKHWYEKEKLTKELEILNTETELKYLKSQINPHFLFNSLNSIYSLALQKSDLAPELILKLSDILRYILYDGSNQRVSLDQELKYLKSYAELEKVRHGDRVNLSLTIDGSIDTQEIVPMLLIPFVENSFKHGFGKDMANGYVKIDVHVNKSTLNFELENSKPLAGMEVKINENYQGGIGLKNVNKRLRLMYPDKHTIEVIETAIDYKVNLKIDLV